MQAIMEESAGQMKLSQMGSAGVWWSVATRQVQDVAKAALPDKHFNDDTITEIVSHLPSMDKNVMDVFAKEGRAMQATWKRMFGLLDMAEDVHEYMTGSKTSDTCGPKHTTNSADFTVPWTAGRFEKNFDLTYAPQLWMDAFHSQPDFADVNGETQRLLKALLHAKGYTAGFSKCGVVLHVAAFDKRLHATYRAFCQVYDILLSKVTDANGPARQVVTYRNGRRHVRIGTWAT